MTGLGSGVLLREVLEDVAHTQTIAADLVGIGGADALAGGAHLILTLLGLVGGIEHTVGGHDEMRLLGDMQTALQLMATLLKGLGLVHEEVGGEHHTIADNVHLTTLEDA